MARSVMVGEVRTGRRITHIPVSGGRWSMVHRDAGDITVDVPLRAVDFRRLERQLVASGAGSFGVWRPGQGMRAELLAALDPARCFLAILEDDEVLEAGPIWAHRYDAGTGVLRVRAAGMRSVFDHRRVMGVVASGTAAAAWQVTWSGLSLATIAKRLIQLAMDHTGGQLPIVLPEDETAVDDADHTRTYHGYDLGILGERLDQLMGVQGGPDITLQPRLTGDRMGVEWVMRAGTEADPLLHQGSGDWTWDAQVPRSGVSGIIVDVDATALAARSWVTGEGMETSTLLEVADEPTGPDALLDRGYPLLESAESRPTVRIRSTAARWAGANLAGQVRPWSTWTVQVRTDTEPRLGRYRPGDFGRVWVPKDHPYLRWRVRTDTYHRARVIRVDGDLNSRLVTLTLAPTMDAR